jgi:hypothetical protein
MPSPPRIKYASYDEYKQLEQQALQKHLDAVPDLLDFLWRHADFEIADLGHDKSWLYESCDWFMVMTKGEGKEWCQWLSDMLLLLLKHVLNVICEYNKLRAQSQNQSSVSSNAKAVRLVKEAVKSFFDDRIWEEDFFDANFTFDSEENLVPIADNCLAN